MRDDHDCQAGKRSLRKYGEQSSEWKYQLKPVLKSIREVYGNLPASEFGPIRFENFRQTLVDKNLSRIVVKRKSNYIIKMFEIGVRLELIPGEYWHRLKTLGPIESNVKKKKKRWVVDPEIVRATQDQLTPIVADMVELQQLVGARRLEAAGISIILLDRDLEQLPNRSHHDLIGVDNFRVGVLQTNHLISLGEKRIAYVSRVSSAPTAASMHRLIRNR